MSDLKTKDEIYSCAVCSTPSRLWIGDYMVTPELWERFSNGDRFICPQCFQVRMGRRFRLSDFTSVLVNDGIKQLVHLNTVLEIEITKRRSINVRSPRK